MTVQDKFWNWQQLGAPKAVNDFALTGIASPNLARIYKYAKETYGGQNLGYSPNPRSIREGTSRSTHTWGALDWRYQDPGPGRDLIFSEFVPILIDWSLELGIDAIHDYFGDRIWRPPGTSGRPENSDGWKDQNGAGAGMGELWATYIHVELHPTAWFDARPFEEVIGVPLPPPPPQPPIYIPPTTPGGQVVFDVNTRVMKQGDSGKDVQFFQSRLNTLAGQGLVLDGQFGAKTKVAVENWQRFFGLYVDGVLGPITQESIIQVSIAQGK